MRNRGNNIFKGIDWVLILCYLVLIFMGWINIYSATVTEEVLPLINLATEYGKQLIWIGLSLPLILLILIVDAKFYERYSSLIYLTSMLSLLMLFPLGKNINGATSWYDLAGIFSIQPSEFAKAATALAIAKLVSDKTFNLKNFNTQLQSFTILLIPAVLITLQPDPGSALVYSAFIFVLYREGLPFYYITIGFISVALFLATLLFGSNPVIYVLAGFCIILLIYLNFKREKAFKRHWLKIIGVFLIIGGYIFSVNYVFNEVFQQRHRDRFNIVLGKSDDVKSIGYNSDQAISTIASGGLSGKGFLEGERTQGEFVPEQQTDYIFTVVGEEWGFLGSTAVILMFAFFCLRILYVAERQKSKFSRVYGYSIAAIFFTHFAVNIGMVIGILPTIGIPLPFFSYGGSGLWGFTVLLFIFIKLDANRSYEW